MDIEKLYQGLNRLRDNSEIGNAYEGCGTDFENPDSSVLADFFWYITQKYKNSIPLWAEAFIQIYNWQFQTMHECVKNYYENLYGDSEYKTIIKIAGYLQENGYCEIAEPYIAAAVDCEDCNYPKEMIHLLPDNWIHDNEEIIWDFYVDILEKHKSDLLK